MTEHDHQPDELRHRLEQLARLVRVTPAFTDAMRWWSGFPLRGRRAGACTTTILDEPDAQLLDLPVGTRVIRRDIELVSALVRPMPVATISELLYEPVLGLDLTTRHAIHDSADPIDTILTGFHRAVCVVLRPNPAPQPDTVALQAHTVLSGAGRPAVLTTECVYWQLITHRQPTTIPHYLATRPALIRAP